MKKVYSN